MSDPKQEAINELIEAARDAALFMDIALPQEGNWIDAYDPDRRRLLAAIAAITHSEFQSQNSADATR